MRTERCHTYIVVNMHFCSPAILLLECWSALCPSESAPQPLRWRWPQHVMVCLLQRLQQLLPLLLRLLLTLLLLSHSASHAC